MREVIIDETLMKSTDEFEKLMKVLIKDRVFKSKHGNIYDKIIIMPKVGVILTTKDDPFCLTDEIIDIQDKVTKHSSMIKESKGILLRPSIWVTSSKSKIRFVKSATYQDVELIMMERPNVDSSAQ